MATLSNLAQRLNLSVDERPLPRLILVTDRHRLADPIAALPALRPGDAVLLRDYDDPNRSGLARQLREATRRHRLKLIIAADVELAVAVKADGVHLPEWAIGPKSLAARRWRQNGPDRLLTAAAHGPRGLFRAHQISADAVLLAPVFDTGSHPGGQVIGPLRFANWIERAPLPTYALGGITAETALRLIASKVTGFAAISAFEE